MAKNQHTQKNIIAGCYNSHYINSYVQTQFSFPKLVLENIFFFLITPIFETLVDFWPKIKLIFNPQRRYSITHLTLTKQQLGMKQGRRKVWKKSGVPVLFGGHNLLPPLIKIGSTDLPKSGGAMAPPAPPGTTPLWKQNRDRQAWVTCHKQVPTCLRNCYPSKRSKTYIEVVVWICNFNAPRISIKTKFHC